MADTYTTNLNLTKPEPGAAEDTWGISLNDDLDTLDAIFSSSGTQVNLNPNQVNFADNKKAIFGTGSDLQIFHDGSHSYISENGTGNLILKGGGQILLKSPADENMIVATGNGAVGLYYDNVAKLQTTSTGIDVTGEVQADTHFTSSDLVATLSTSGSGGSVYLRPNGQTQSSGQAVLDTSGNLDVSGTVTSDALTVSNGTNTTSIPTTSDRVAFTGASLNYVQSAGHLFIQPTGDLTLNGSGSEIMRLKDGKVGIGTSSPSANLHVSSTGDTILRVTSADGNGAFLDLGDASDTDGGRIVYDSGSNLAFYTASTERARIDSSGNLLVGTTSSANTTDGVRITSGGYITIAQDAASVPTLFLNKITNDGQHIQFQKDGSEVGSIGVDNADNLVIEGNSTHSGIQFGTSALLPHKNGQGGTAADAVIDLGISGGRFKDLYLSGGHMNGAANSFTFVSGGNASNAGANILLYGQSHASLANTTIFRASGTETARIDADKNFMVGTTTARVAEFGTTYGVSLLGQSGNEGQIQSQTNGKINAIFDRRTSDGSIIQFRKDGSTVGSISAAAGTIRVNGTDGSGLYFANASVFPSADNVKDLGASSNRFKDLHLSGTANVNKVEVGDGTDSGVIAPYNLYLTSGNSNVHIFNKADGSEKARIDSSGNLLVGTTTNNVGSEGVILRERGDVRAVRSGGTAGVFNRLTSDGDVIALQKDGTTVGSIGANAGVMTLASPNGNKHYVSNSALFPSADNILDLGTSSQSYKDLHLSGTGYFGTRVGIKNTSPSSQFFNTLVVGDTSGDNGITIQSSATGRGVLAFSDTDAATAGRYDGFINYNHTSQYMSFHTNTGNEHMRIDNVGNLLIGQTAGNVYNQSSESGFKLDGSSGNLQVARSNGTPAFFNRLTSDGTMLDFRRDGVTHAQIGILSSTSGSDAYFASGSSSVTGTGLRFISVTSSIYIAPCRGDGTISDNYIDLGSSSSRFDDIYATNGTIQTSDRNEKQDIQELSDAEQRVAVACKGLIRRYKFNSAVTEKGDDARYHFGIIAQDLQDAFTAEGLDAGDYGMFISSTYTDDNGIEQTRLGVRYNELLAFIIATL